MACAVPILDSVAKWQSQFSPNESNDLESIKRKPASVAYFHRCHSRLIPQFSQINFDNICKCASKDAIFFPNAYTPNIAAVKGTIIFRNYVTEHKSKWKTAIKEAKLVFIFSKVSWSEMESATSDILSIRKNRSLPIIYVKSYMYFPNMPSYYYPFSSIIFHGSNVEASTFLVKTKDEKELREELLEWKRGLYFLKNYNIIAFYFMENEMITTNGKIFREIFNTEPFSVRFHKDWSKDKSNPKDFESLPVGLSLRAQFALLESSLKTFFYNCMENFVQIFDFFILQL
ncbi:Geminin coiled-coil domain-containing protein [Dirofilaria immitis]